MAIPAPNLAPPFNIVRLSHVELGVSDLSRARAFYVDTLGLEPSHEVDGCLYLRALEERGHHCLVLRRGNAGTVGCVAFRVWDEDHLDRAEAWFVKQGLEVEWPGRPFIKRVLRIQTPSGIPVEFHARMDQTSHLTQVYARHRGVRPLRIDHVNLFSADVDADARFWNAMGFRITEYTADEETGRNWAVWMQRKGGVHDVAFTNGVGPRLHHVAFWVPTPLNIIELLDVMSTTGYLANIERGPGRHGISNAFFLYVRDADGHRTELYCSDYQTVDPDHQPIRWDLKDPQRQTLWGAPAPASWFNEGSTFVDTPTRASTLAAQPIVAP